MTELFRPSLVKIDRDLNGAVRIQIDNGAVAVLPPKQAIDLGAAILKAAGCNLDFKIPA